MDDGGSAGWFRASREHLFTLWGAWAPAAEPPGVARGLIFTSVRSFLNATLARALWHYLTPIVTAAVAAVGGKCVETAWKQEITGEWTEEPEEEVRSENTGSLGRLALRSLQPRWFIWSRKVENGVQDMTWGPRGKISCGYNIEITCTQNANWFPWNSNSLPQNTNLWPYK